MFLSKYLEVFAFLHQLIFNFFSMNRQMVQNLSFIDQTRVAVWGWSYGGFLAGQMLAEDRRGLLSCAAAVAPVVKWQLYGK